ncbi:hypothetical protein Dda_1203 [Drechslerella dactyloides]|uniref:Uncharacterized protein n=1 Tax=Drechslerella dactyloides TaxID=74499 RepID=A0AAD6J5R7_DREDA|nr:hypothetical protein Dda_1203 [Drechslerella dactyloides]
MGNSGSKQYHPGQLQVVSLLWNDEHIGTCPLIDLQRNFCRLRRSIHNFEPRGDRFSRTAGQVTLVYDLAPCQDIVLWARPADQPHSDDVAKLSSPARFGGSEALRVVVFTLFRRLKNGQNYSVGSALSEAFVAGYPFRHDFAQRDARAVPQCNEDELGTRDISAFLTLLESFVEVSTVLDCLDNGNAPTRLDIEHSYLKYRKHIKHNLDNVEEALRFLRVGDVLGDTQMVQDFTFPVLSSFETLFKKYRNNSHNITFAQYGERHWNLSRRLCDYLELEHNEFQKRKKARETAILTEVPHTSRTLLSGIDSDLGGSGISVYEDQMTLDNANGNSMFITLSSHLLQKLIESSPVTIDPSGTSQDYNNNNPQMHVGGGGNSGDLKDVVGNDHVVIQLRVFKNLGKNGTLGLPGPPGGNADRLTPLHTPIPSRRGSPAPSDYFFVPHADHLGFPPRSSANIGNGNGGGHGRGGHCLNRSNTFHSVDDLGFPHKGDYGPDLGRYNSKDERFQGRRMAGNGGMDDVNMAIDGGRFDTFGGVGIPGAGMGMDMQSITARMMEKAVREEKKRDYVMPWVRSGNGNPVNGQKLIGYGAGEGYR